MRDLSKLAAVVLCGLAMIVAVGCGAPQDCNDCPQQSEPNPFGEQPCDADQCFHSATSNPNETVVESGNGIRVGPAEDPEVNQAALQEVKDGPPARVRDGRPQSGRYVQDDEPAREGVWICVRCRRPTVGKGWHELWTDDGTPMTCLCEKCWRTSTNAEKAAHLRAYARRSKLKGTQRFYVDALIEEIKEGRH